MSWYFNSDNKLTHDDLPKPIDGIFSEPYPATFWRLDSNNILTLNSEDWSPFPEPMEYLTPPYPASMWYLNEDNKLRNILLPNELILGPEVGAFLNAESLEYVKIPKSVKSIGDASFVGTKLKKVCISKNCSYTSTSFPKGCEIIFYEDMHDESYRILVSGKHSYRYTDTITHDEESTMNEIP